MNAIKYIKDHGVEKAREAITDRPRYANFVWIYNERITYGVSGFSGATNLTDLKRLVESVDYVAIHGYEKSKDILKNAPVGAECYSWSIGNSGVRDKTVELVKLKQAIADYELIYEVK